MINENDASINIGGSSNKSELKGGKIYSDSGAKETKNNVSISIKGDATDTEAEAGTIIAKASEIDIAQLKAEIQPFLEQLAAFSITQNEAATKAIKETIQKQPTLKQRLLNASKAGGSEALKTIFNHPIVAISVETVKGFLEGN
jgi:hypothetical protein